MSRDKVQLLVAMLVGFAVGCAVIHATGGQPLAAFRPSVNLAVPYSPARASHSKFMQPLQPMRARASSVVANSEPDAEMGRRQMLAGAFGLAVAASNRAALAGEDPRFDKVFGKPYAEPELQKAEDFTRYDKVVTKKGFKKAEEPVVAQAEAAPGSVEVQPALVPAVVIFSALATAGLPALLSPGETAKNAQDKASGAGRIKPRQTVKGKKTPAKAPAKKKSGGLFR